MDDNERVTTSPLAKRKGRGFLFCPASFSAGNRSMERETMHLHDPKTPYWIRQAPHHQPNIQITTDVLFMRGYRFEGQNGLCRAIPCQSSTRMGYRYNYVYSRPERRWVPV